MRVKLEDDLRDAIINDACDTDVSLTAFVNALLRSGLRQHQTAHHPAEAGGTADTMVSLLKEALFASKFTVVEGDLDSRRALRKLVLEAYAPTVDTSSIESVLGDLYATHLFDHTAPGMLGIIAAVLKNPVKTETPCPCCGKHYRKAYGIQVTCDAPKCREWVRLALINQAEAVSCDL